MKKQEAPKPTKETTGPGKKNTTGKETSSTKKTKEPAGYPLYPDSDDIYSKFKEEQEIDPENPGQRKDPNADFDVIAEEDEELEDDIMGDDLDVPGSELDDDEEDAGNEDEENNYYSIGGDRHHDLDEDRDDDF
ncbi:MAG: hypothetical protein ABIQ02_05565 [Saprospiraceae bacterium]